MAATPPPSNQQHARAPPGHLKESKPKKGRQRRRKRYAGTAQRVCSDSAEGQEPTEGWASPRGGRHARACTRVAACTHVHSHAGVRAAAAPMETRRNPLLRAGAQGRSPGRFAPRPREGHLPACVSLCARLPWPHL